MWKDATLNRLRSAELGTPETPRREAGLPVFLREPDTITSTTYENSIKNLLVAILFF